MYTQTHSIGNMKTKKRRKHQIATPFCFSWYFIYILNKLTMAFFIYGKVDKGLELSELTNGPFLYYLRAWGGFGLKI